MGPNSNSNPNPTLIQVHADGHSPADMRASFCALGSTSFEPTFGRPCKKTPGLLFELVAPADAKNLETLMAVAPEAEGRDPNDDQRRSRSATLTFVRTDGQLRRLRVQVTELTHSKVRHCRISNEGITPSTTHPCCVLKVCPCISCARCLSLAPHTLSAYLCASLCADQQQRHVSTCA